MTGVARALTRTWPTPLDASVVAMMGFGWCLLWGEFSLANVLSGLLLGAGLRWSLRSATARRGVRLGALAQLVGIVAIDLVKSTVTVVREVLTPTDYTDEVIVEVEAGLIAADHLLLLSTAITLTPGTAVVDANAETGTLYLHLLHADTEAEVTRHVSQLVRLAARAFPTDPSWTSASEPSEVTS